MIIVERLIIDGREFTRTYSNDNRYVVRDGISYDEAVDPAEYGRTYTEGEKKEESEEEATAQEILDILLGGEEA